MRVPRTTEKQYRQRRSLAMTVYVGVMVLAWPLVRTADDTLLKIALVKITDREAVNRIPVIAKEITGHADNSAYPLINVDIKMVLVVPANVKGKVPVLMMFGRPSLPAPAQPSIEDLEKINQAFKEMMIKSNPEMKIIFEKYPAYQPITRIPPPNPFGPAKPDEELTPQERLLAAGWGYCTIDPGSIQADNGAGLTRGIIGLTNKGQPRKPEDWGSLRAWAWGAARALDYLETDTRTA